MGQTGSPSGAALSFCSAQEEKGTDHVAEPKGFAGCFKKWGRFETGYGLALHGALGADLASCVDW